MALGQNGETIMLYSEAAYFDGAAVQHIADYYEHLRLQRLAREAVAAHRRRFPRVAAMWSRARG